MSSPEISSKIFGQRVADSILRFLAEHDIAQNNRLLFSSQPGTCYCTFYMGGVCVGIQYDGKLVMTAASVFRVTKSELEYYVYNPDDFHENIIMKFQSDLEAIFTALSQCVTSGLRARFIWPFGAVLDNPASLPGLTDAQAAKLSAAQAAKSAAPVKKKKANPGKKTAKGD